MGLVKKLWIHFPYNHSPQLPPILSFFPHLFSPSTYFMFSPPNTLLFPLPFSPFSLPSRPSWTISLPIILFLSLSSLLSIYLSIYLCLSPSPSNHNRSRDEKESILLAPSLLVVYVCTYIWTNTRRCVEFLSKSMYV